MDCDIKIENNKIFVPLKQKWLILKPEEEVRQKFICRLINHYGYSLEQMDQEVKVSNSQRGQGRAMADIILWRSKQDRLKSNSPVVVVECKADHITIHEEDYFQGYNYASWAGADFFVTTNLKETRVFRVIKGKMPKQLDEIIDIPNANIISDAKKVKELLKQTKVFTRDEFSKLLFKCHNIIRNNDKLSPEAAFDEISKILFIKIRFERTNDGVQLFSLEEFQKLKEAYNKTKSRDSTPYYQDLFEKTKEDFSEDQLFAQNDMIRIRETSFEAIVRELEKYNLSATSDDIKGIAFEKFLGKTFRGELGQFFTPRTLVDFMVEVLDPDEGEIIADPACGSGGFLIKAFEYVREKIEAEIQKEKENIKQKYYDDNYDKSSEKEKSRIDEKVNNLFNKLNYELNIQNNKSRLQNLSYECIYGTDANPRMARTAKMNMIMHGDGHGGVHHHDGLLNVNGIFENRFDVILTNPPFGSRVEKSLKITETDKFTDLNKIKKYRDQFGETYDEAMRQVSDNIGESLVNLYDMGKMSALTEVLFIDRCLRLLRPGGRMGIVLPEGVLNNTNLQRVRDYIESKAKIIFIVSIPQDVFIASGATVKPSLLFFKKFTDKEAALWEKISETAINEITVKYSGELNPIKEKLQLRGKDAQTNKEKKELKKKVREMEDKINDEIKSCIKKEFDYEIPIAEVKKAGISSTGAPIENELEPIAKDYKKYRRKNKLWKTKYEHVTYEITLDENIFRLAVGEKIELYG